MALLEGALPVPAGCIFNDIISMFGDGVVTSKVTSDSASQKQLTRRISCSAVSSSTESLRMFARAYNTAVCRPESLPDFVALYWYQRGCIERICIFNFGIPRCTWSRSFSKTSTLNLITATLDYPINRDLLRSPQRCTLLTRCPLALTPYPLLDFRYVYWKQVAARVNDEAKVDGSYSPFRVSQRTTKMGAYGDAEPLFHTDFQFWTYMRELPYNVDLLQRCNIALIPADFSVN